MIIEGSDVDFLVLDCKWVLDISDLSVLLIGNVKVVTAYL